MFMPVAPGIGMAQLVRPPRQELLASFVGADACWTSSGRAGLLWAHGLARGEGRDVVLMPGYMCKETTDGLSAHGMAMRFYRVDRRLRPDIEHLRTLMDSRVCAIIVVHYFGFPQDTARVSRICGEADVWLIEDCAHALFSCVNGEPLGRAGDAAIFSLPKMLPAPDGGFLVVRDPARLEEIRLPRLGHALQCGHWPARTVLRALARPAEPLVGRPRVRFWRGKARGAGSHTGAESIPPVDEPASPLAMRIALTARQDIIGRRRRNYDTLARMLGGLPGCELLYPSVPKGICPWRMSFLVRDREILTEALSQKGIPTGRWPAALPEGVGNGDYPQCRRLAKQVMCLPVHQDLTPRHMEHIARAFEEAMRAVTP